MKTIDCSKMTAMETEKEIWKYTDDGFQFGYSQFGNPTFVKYDRKGNLLGCVSFVYPYIDLRFCRPRES
mgnify:CR=1 FL=1